MTTVRAEGSPSAASRFEQLSALLVGLIAIVVAVLVVIEVSVSHEGARGDAAASRLASEVTTRVNVSQAPLGFQVAKTLEATRVAMEGTSRQLVSLEDDDAAGQAIGAADQVAWERLIGVAHQMAAVPDESSPLDAYARTAIASTDEETQALLAEQNRQADIAAAASDRGMTAVLGLSLAALAGVLAGLAAVVGKGRPAVALLVLGCVAAGAAVVAAALAARWSALT